MRKGQVIHWKKRGVKPTGEDIAIRCVMVFNIIFGALVCFVFMAIDKQAMSSRLADFEFLFCYGLPVMLLAVLYGTVPAMVSYAMVYIAALFIMPNAAYLFTMHLVCILLAGHFHQNKSFLDYKRTLLAVAESTVILGALFFLLYGLVTNRSLLQFKPIGILYGCGIVAPMVFVGYTIFYLILRFTPPRLIAFLPMAGFKKEYRFIDDDEHCFWMPSSRWRLSSRITGYFALEGLFLAVGAALFANMLIPEMGVGHHEMPWIYVPVFDSLGISPRMYGTTDVNGYYVDPNIIRDLGMTFDAKLILYLFDIVVPIICFFNFRAQKNIALPIQQMTVGMRLFSDRTTANRDQIADKVAGMEISTGDEIEQLYATLVATTKEITAHIDDIKREKLLEEDLRVAQAAAKSKTVFLSNMSHEIRTPINAVLGMDEMILREARDKDIIRYAKDIQNSGRTLLSLVNDILDFSKLEAGKMELVPVQYELSSVLNDLINTARQRLGEKDVNLVVDINEYTPHMLYGDEIRIKQVATNILTNAVKYTEEGSITFKLDFERCEKSDDEAMLRFVISDTGIGIREEDQKKLFSAFDRLDEERNRNIEGTGLGMSIVKSLLDLMDSTLELHSVYGEGSTFSFRLVQKVVSWEPIGDFTETYEKSIESLPKYRESFHAPSAKILVVDDTPVNLTVVQGLLKDTGMQIDTADSGAQCLNMTKKKEYDIILLDHRMPGMDGIETYHAIKEDGDNKNHRTPVIALTANAISGSRETYLSEGFTDYLSKPINSKRMEEMLIRYLPRDKVILPDESGFDETAAGGEADEDSRLAVLKNTEGIDYNEAIRNCLKEDILLSAAQDFLAGISSTSLNIEISNIAADWNNYTVLVHGLKSSARLIGATHLSEKAKELEALGDRAKSGDQRAIDDILEKTPGLIEEYKSYEEKLAFIDPDLVQSGDWSTSGGSAAEVEDDRPAIDDGAFKEAIDGIGMFVEAFDYDGADDIIAQLKDYHLNNDQEEIYNRLKVLVRNLDRDQILKEIRG